MAWITVTAASQSYSTLTGAVVAWMPSGLSIEARSRVSALLRVHPLPETAQRDIDFAWGVDSDAPWQVAEGTPVFITSSRMTIGV